VKERPILFSGPMVRAIIQGRKTQTRRVAKEITILQHVLCQEDWPSRCPHGLPGDRLWVRETFAIGKRDGDVIYAADPKWLVNGVPVPPPCNAGKRHQNCWTPSIFMPRFACRIMLEITGVRVERIQDIDNADICSEGAGEGQFGFHCSVPATRENELRGSFAALWDSINVERGYGWDANPWVWVIEFKRIS